MSQHVKNITDSTFNDEVTGTSGPVLVDFWAEWCGPCKALAPVLNDIADDYVDAVRIRKINADENKEASGRYNVRGLPTMILFVDGEEKERILGLVSKTRIAALLDRYVEG
ncbi:thioredoxin [Rhodanobacter sp. PCA2]|uniref:thioredoxin n=1 Tax=Rhodanobacter sp. PCA2 TaxID=2006117 RepID=UPI0015E687DD|nr:thioredoxin [Rhodanobacter sp. PCA2]MBA2078399.1 thioredoxin [Rhodanobacter sp. PCA2]